MRERVLTSSVLIPSVLAVLFLSNPWPLAALGFLIWVLCTLEGTTLLAPNTLFRPITYLGFPVAALGIIFAPGNPLIAAGLAVSVPIGVGCTYLAASGSARNFAVLDLASLWYSAPLACCLLLHRTSPNGHLWDLRPPLLLALLPVWAGDVAAIFAGQAFGKRSLAPTVSPKKTVEGVIANLIAAGLMGALVGPAIGKTLGVSLACGIAVGLLGQLGDLFESYIKRRAGTKDSGWILPGHGGILDRIDSLLFAAPVVALILAYFR